MLTKLKTLLRKLDCWLRDQPYVPAGEYVSRRWDDFLEEQRNPDPIRTRVYYAICRFWSYHWLCNPRQVWFSAKCAYQRLVRGWDDRVPWSVDWWMNGIMPDILRKLKKDTHGIPSSMFEGLETKPDESWNYTEGAYVIAQKRWDDILDKIIAGFEANQRAKEGLYEKELGDYPLYRPDGVSRDAWKETSHDRFQKSCDLAERDQKTFEEGMRLFAEHYNDLWD